MRALFAVPGFGRLYAGVVTSAFGDWCLLLVLAMWVKELTHSNGLAGMVMATVLGASLFTPLLGSWIDRVRRKPMLVWGNLASAVVVLPLLWVRGAADVWIIFVVAALYGTSLSMLGAGITGLVKDLVDEESLAVANSAIQTPREGLRLIGPLIGAGLYGWFGGATVAVLDAVTFVVAAVLIASVPSRQPRVAVGDVPWRTQVLAGVRHIGADRVLRHVLVGFGLMALTLGFAEATIFAVLEEFGKSVTFAGVVVTIQGVGAVVGVLLTPLLIRRVREVGALVAAMVVMSLALGVVSLATTLTLMLVAAGFVGLAIPPIVVGVTTLVQKRTEQTVLGRVSLAMEVLMGAPQVLSMTAGSILVGFVSFRVLFAVMAVSAAVGAGYLARTLRSEFSSSCSPGSDPSTASGSAPS